MAWDASRPVPYRRLVKEWLIYAALMAAVFLLFLQGSTNVVGLLLGLLASLPLYVGMSAVMAKLGYQRKTLAELRTPRAPATTGSSGSTASSGRSKPAPTRRTSAGSNRPSKRKR
ncbi:hypothetical protein BH24ACT5_BH24ACT5_31740 [soil metagenome]